MLLRIRSLAAVAALFALPLCSLAADDPKAVQGTTRGLLEKYGPERVFGTPLSEDAMTGTAIGMALAGLRPIHVHIRMDFLMLAMNQLVNVAAKTRYMYGGQVHLPLVVRAMIGKSWGQGAQHSHAGVAATVWPTKGQHDIDRPGCGVGATPCLSDVASRFALVTRRDHR